MHFIRMNILLPVMNWHSNKHWQSLKLVLVSNVFILYRSRDFFALFNVYQLTFTLLECLWCRCSTWKLPTEVRHLKDCNLKYVCNDDWNIDHRRWSENMSSIGGPTFKKKYSNVWPIHPLIKPASKHFFKFKR